MDKDLWIEYDRLKTIAEKMGKTINFRDYYTEEKRNFTQAIADLKKEIDKTRPWPLDDIPPELYRMEEVLRLGIKMGIVFAIEDIQKNLKIKV